MATDPRAKPSAEYKANVGNYDFNIRSYEAGQSYLDGKYLFTHRKEAGADFAIRKTKAVPAGFARAVINDYKSLISLGRVSRETENEMFEEFYSEDCDRRGTNLDAFIMEQCFPVSEAVGHTFVLVDTPKSSGEVITQADAVDGKIVPYLIHFSPTEVINWEFDALGNLLWIAVLQGPRVDPQTGRVTQKDTIKLWTQQTTKILSTRGSVIEEIEHKLGIVPFAVMYSDRSVRNPNVGVSAIANISHYNRRIFNLESLLDEFLYKQCFNTLAVPDTIMTDEEGAATIGTSNTIPVREGAITPTYITPPVAPAEFLEKSIMANIARIRTEAGLENKSAGQTSMAQSGISKAFDFHSTNTRLAKKARNLEDFENKVAEIWFKWMDAQLSFEVQYPRSFDVSDTASELDELERVLALKIAVPTLKRIRVQQSVPKILGDISQEDRDQLKAEIEASTFTASGVNGPSAVAVPTGGLFDNASDATPLPNAPTPNEPEVST